MIAAAVMASVVAAEGTYYSTTSTTVIDTITSCGPEVTNCPGKTYSTAVSSPVVYANHSTPCTESSTSTPAAVTYPASYPVSVPTYPASASVSIGTKYITTCVPTVITSLYTVTPTAAPSATYVTYAHNATTPTYSAKPTIYTGAASAVQGSVVLAAAAGLVAFFA